MIPTIHEDMDRRILLISLVMPVMSLYVPELDKGKALNFLFVREETETAGGVVARTALTSYCKSKKFRKRPCNLYTSPDETILCLNSFQRMYTQMLCGLIMREEVTRIGTSFASGLVRAIGFLQLSTGNTLFMTLKPEH